MALLLNLLIFSCFTQARELNLKDVYQTAVINTEVIKRNQARVEQAQEKKSQAIGAMLPSLALRANYLKIQAPDQGGGTPRGLVLTDQYSSSLYVTQPLFKGLREYSVHRQAKATLLQNQYLADASRITLYQGVITAYYNLIIAQKDFENYKTLEKYSSERVKELRQRADIGRSRRGELLQSEAQLSNVKAQLVDAEGIVAESEAQLAFYLNDRGRSEKETYVLAEEELPTSIKDLDFYQSRALERPDLKAKMAEVQITDESISQAKGGHLPSLDAFGNYYLTRTGLLQTSKWDVGLTFLFPLFQGGVVQSQVKEAVEKKTETILAYDEIKRGIERDVFVLHESVSRSLKQLKELEAAMKKTEDTYKENIKDYRYGLVTTLDVLVSLNSFVETKRTYDRVKNQTMMSYKNLEALAGVLP